MVERREGFARYKRDVKERGKPFYPFAMFHDTVMSLVVVCVIIGLACVWYFTSSEEPGDAGILGPFLAQVLQGGTYINDGTLSRFYAIHMLMIPGAIAALIGLHLYLVIRLGVTSPPWSKEAAGTGPLDGHAPNGKVARAGLSRFRRGR